MTHKSLTVLFTRVFLASGILFGNVVLSGTALGQGTKPPQQQTPAPATTESKPPEAPKALPGSINPDSTGAPVDPKSYVIGAEDILHIQVWREPELSRAVAVRPDGKITLNLIGDVQAEGLTPDRLTAQLKQALSEQLTHPDVTVTVVQVNSKRFTIEGQVNRPGVYPLVTPVHIFDALANAGGFRDFANTKKVVIIRGTQRIKFNYNEVLKGKKLGQNILVENGDIIHVP